MEGDCRIPDVSRIVLVTAPHDHVGASLGSGRTQCTHFTRCGPPLSGKPACREGRDDCRGCCDALTCSRLSALCLSLSCGSYFRRLSARALGRGVRRLGGLYWRLIMAAYWQRTWELVSVVASARRSSSIVARRKRQRRLVLVVSPSRRRRLLQRLAVRARAKARCARAAAFN